MRPVETVMATLRSKAKEGTRKLFSRHGMPYERILGVNVADLKPIAKSIKGQQSLAMELYETGVMEAMYLAGMVADGAKMTREELNRWAQGAAEMQMIAEYTVPWVTVENAHARELAIEWMKSPKERVAAAGWSTYCGLLSLRPDDALDLKEVKSLLDKVVKQIHGAPNRVRYTMNTFVICTAMYVMPLASEARAAAKKIGVVKVEMGETECKVPLATAYIEKVEAAGKLGKKRKTIRC